MSSRRVMPWWLVLFVLVTALSGIEVSLRMKPVGAQGVPHVHQFTTQSPQLSCLLNDTPPASPFFHAGGGNASDYQPMAGCLVRLNLDSHSGWQDFDACTNPAGNCAFEGVGWQLAGCNTYPRQAANPLVIDKWEASGGDGAFGWLDTNGAFVDIAQTPDPKNWAAVTYYRAPSSAMSVTVKLTLRDNPVIPDPDGGPAITTMGGETTSSTRNFTVMQSPGSWTTFNGISGGSIQKPATGSYAGWGESVPCAASLAVDLDQRSSGCGLMQISDPVNYTWTATGGTFPNGATGPNVNWKAPNTNGTYTLTLYIDDQASLPSGDTGVRNDNNVSYTRTITVGQATWTVGSAIAPVPPATQLGIQLPLDQTRVMGGTELSCTATPAEDNDIRTPFNGTATTQADTVAYYWSAVQNGASVGFFGGGPVSNVRWHVPSTGGGEVQIKVFLDDQDDQNKPMGDGGTRNDIQNPPLEFSRTITYHNHLFTSTGNTADQRVLLKHVSNHSAATGAHAGEILKLDLTAITPDQDKCDVPGCTFTSGMASEVVAKHRTVSLNQSGGGDFGTLDPVTGAFIVLSGTSQVSQITHYRVNEYLTGGPIQVWARVDDAEVAIDPYFVIEVSTAMDPVKDCTPTVINISPQDLGPELHRTLTGKDGCGCPGCLISGHSSIDPSSGGVHFTVPASSFQWQGVDLGLSFTYNSDAKADPRLNDPNLPGVDPVGDLARMSEHNSRWTHNWAQAIEIVWDGAENHALWHNGRGGSVGFDQAGTSGWASKDSFHTLASGGSITTTLRVRRTHSAGDGESAGGDERLIQTTLPYSWFDLRDAAGTIYHFDTPVWQRGTGAAIAYFPLQKITDRWGRGVTLTWNNGNLASVAAFVKNPLTGTEVPTGKSLSFIYANGLLKWVTDAVGHTHNLFYTSVLDELGVGRQKLTSIWVEGPGLPDGLVDYKWNFYYGVPAEASTYYNGSYTGDLVVRKTEPTGKIVFYSHGSVNPNRATAGDWDGVLATTWYQDGATTHTITRSGSTITYGGGVSYTLCLPPLPETHIS